MTLFDPQRLDAQAQLARWRAAGLAGVDEAGRGPLAGPVCAAAVCLPHGFDSRWAQDSKALSARARSEAAQVIKAQAAAFGIGWASVAEVDRHNVLQATFLAMQRALQAMSWPVRMVLVDGNRLPPLGEVCQGAQAVVKGDALIDEIGAASILAKVARDEFMAEQDEIYPGYGFARHKGYGTRAHQQALSELGPCALHRHSFAPVRVALEQRQLGTAQ